MNDTNRRPRPSLRGRGREIMLGQTENQAETNDLTESPMPSAAPQEIDPAALPLTPEEKASLLDFDSSYERSASTFADDDDMTFPDVPPSDAPQVVFGESLGAKGVTLQELIDEPVIEEYLPPAPESEAPPLPERKPEIPIGVPPIQQDIWPVNKPGRVTSLEQHEGGLIVPPGEVLEPAQPTEIADPFAPVLKRQPSEELFHSTAEPDKALLDALVDDDRLKKLWDQIDAMHEELVQHVQGDRGSTDVYQQELLRASSLLLESRTNYDDARAIVYRVRADLKRQEKVNADVTRYRPLLLNYYLGWGIAWVVLFALKELFAGVADAVGVGVVAAFYHPMLFGVLGALISGYLTLERHTTRLRDFDPIHISWYLFNPLLGGVMGLMMFLLYAIINDDVLQETSTFRLEIAVAWLLCAVAGMNQNNVLRQMNDLFKRVGRRSSE